MAENKSHHYKSNIKTKSRFSLLVVTIIVALFGVAGLYMVFRSFAASGSLSLVPGNSSVGIGDNFSVTIYANSGTDLVNAVQADLTYPSDKLEFVSIDATYPSVSAYEVQVINSGGAGSVRITRGNYTALSGNKVVAKVNFKAIANGSAAVAFADTSSLYRSSDNTNILVSKNGGTYSISDTTAPSAPSGLTVSNKTTSSVSLAWTASSDNVAVTGYRIYRNGNQVGTATTTSFNNTGLTPNTSYSYTIAAVDATGNVSAQSAALNVSTLPDTTAPSAPSGLTVSNKTTSSVSLAWTASSDNVAVTGYRIYRNGNQVGTATTTSFNNTGLTPNTSYSYTIAAVDAAGNVSAQSAALNASTLPDTTAPSTPSGLTVSSQAGYNINLQWNQSTDNVAVTGYRIYRNGIQVGTSATTSYKGTVDAAGTYQYTVAAVDAAGNISSQSAAISATFKVAGDINGDKKVDIIDLSILLTNYTLTGANQADISGDGVVDIVDLSILLMNYSE